MTFLRKLQNQSNNDSWQLFNSQFQIKMPKYMINAKFYASKDENLTNVFLASLILEVLKTCFAFYNKCD
jgi:hypothetical protein